MAEKQINAAIKKRLCKPRDFRLVAHYRNQSWAVEFLCDKKRKHRTQFTNYKQEAERWCISIVAYGWCVSGAPHQISVTFDQEHYVIAFRKAAKDRLS